MCAGIGPLPFSSLLSMSRAELEQGFTPTSSSGAVSGDPRFEPLSLQPSSRELYDKLTSRIINFASYKVR